jgi:hypothetical protein
MISRLTLAAALFSVLATATLTFAAESKRQPAAEPASSSKSVATPSPVIILPPVEVTGRRQR